MHFKSNPNLNNFEYEYRETVDFMMVLFEEIMNQFVNIDIC
mgnify:CR=1 FL=1